MTRSKSKTRNTTWMAMCVGHELAEAVARAIESRRVTISDALGMGLAMWLELIGEVELAAMMRDGRGTVPRQSLRHIQRNVGT